MLHIAIIEDNTTDAKKLQELLLTFSTRNGETLEIDSFPDAIGFLERYRSIYDITFMDIELPYMDGITAAHKLRELDQHVILFFVTNMAQYAINGYEVDALDYILKPLHYGAFEAKMRKAIALCRSRDNSVTVSRQDGLFRLRMREVLYIEVRGHRLQYHTENGVLESGGSLTETEEQLGKHGFLRCHKSLLVNQRHIAGVLRDTLRLTNGEELPISRLRKKEFMSELAACFGNDGIR